MSEDSYYLLGEEGVIGPLQLADLEYLEAHGMVSHTKDQYGNTYYEVTDQGRAFVEERR